MTKRNLILSIIPILASDVMFSVWYVSKYQPYSDRWKLHVWLIVAVFIIALSMLTAKKESGKYWKSILILPSVSTAYMALKNMSLGLIWHKDIFYLGSKGFDAEIAIYLQNGTILIVTLFIITLVFSGLFRYVNKSYKPKR